MPTIIFEKLTQRILSRFGSQRVVSIIWYGSSLDTTLPFRDYDVFVTLDEYNVYDFQQASSIRKEYSKENVSIHLDYYTWVQKKGSQHYQFGRHGVYFLNILSEGKLLYGENNYKVLASKLRFRHIQKDLRYRIEEYFYRIQKEIRLGLPEDTSMLKKYFLRIVIDLLLYAKEINFDIVAKINYINIIKKHVPQSDIIPDTLKDDILILTRKTCTMKQISELYKKLYNTFIQTYNHA